MADVALTRIQHGNEDGSVTVVEENEPVKGLPADVVKDLKAQGLIGSPPASPQEQDDLQEENDELRAQVEELKAKLAEAKKDPPPPPDPNKK